MKDSEEEMQNLIECLPPFDEQKRLVNVVVETPKGSRIKYAYERDVGLFALKKALPKGMAFPFNFGFIPGTEAEDGDPLDILILNEEPLVPGCFLTARLVGAIKAEQVQDGAKERNDRLIGMAISKKAQTAVQPMKLDKQTLAEIEYFFESYNRLGGKNFRVLGHTGPEQARALVHKASERYAKKAEQSR